MSVGKKAEEAVNRIEAKEADERAAVKIENEEINAIKGDKKMCIRDSLAGDRISVATRTGNINLPKPMFDARRVQQRGQIQSNFKPMGCLLYTSRCV